MQRNKYTKKANRIDLFPILYYVLVKYFKMSFFASEWPEITNRFQTAKSDVRALLLQCLLPWLENVELVAANVTPATPLSYIMVRINFDIYFMFNFVFYF